MVTQSTFPGGLKTEQTEKDMSPQNNIHAPSFEEDDFDIPQVV